MSFVLYPTVFHSVVFKFILELFMCILITSIFGGNQVGIALHFQFYQYIWYQPSAH